MVKEMLSAIKGACEACVRQEKEERDGIRAQIQQAKVRTPSVWHEWAVRCGAVRCQETTSRVSFFFPVADSSNYVPGLGATAPEESKENRAPRQYW